MPWFRWLVLGLMLQALAISPAAAGKRVALVVGNAAYQHAPALANPANDAADIAKVLTAAGFDVTLGVDLNRRAFLDKLHDFTRTLDGADTAVLFYAGHGLQVSGYNYLVPVDAKLDSARDLDFETVGVNFVLRQIEVGRKGKTSIVFLDACRDNPLSRNLARSMGARGDAVGKGLAEVQTGVGTFIAYSTQPGNVALDGSGRNSPFTQALAVHVTEPGKNLTSVMIEVRNDVLKATDGRQVPWDHSALTKEFYFQRPDQPARASAAATGTGNRGLIQTRLRAIEEQTKSKSDRKQTLGLVKLEQLKERVRQIGEAIRRDRQRIFDARNQRPRATGSSKPLNREVGAIQMQIARRAVEKKALQGQIAKLNAELGRSAALDK